MELAKIPIQGSFPARTLSRVKPRTRRSSQLTPECDGRVTRSAKTAYVMLANFSVAKLTVPKHIVLGTAQEVSEEMINKISVEEGSDIDRPQRKRKKETLHEKLLPGKLNRLTPEDSYTLSQYY